jgi:hypothetical protein
VYLARRFQLPQLEVQSVNTGDPPRRGSILLGVSQPAQHQRRAEVPWAAASPSWASSSKGNSDKRKQSLMILIALASTTREMVWASSDGSWRSQSGPLAST